MDHKPASAVAPGDLVRVVDEHYVEHLALITTVHGPLRRCVRAVCEHSSHIAGRGQTRPVWAAGGATGVAAALLAGPG